MPLKQPIARHAIPAGFHESAPRIESTLTHDSICRMSLDEIRQIMADVCSDQVTVLDRVIDAVQRDGIALLDDVPVASDTALLAMCQYVGALVPATERPLAYLDHVKPAEAEAPAVGEAPLSQQRGKLMPHTDQSARGNPPDYLALACVENEAEKGGESVLVPFEPICADIRRTAPEAYELLQDAVYPIFNDPKNDWGSTGPLIRRRRGHDHDGTEREFHETRFRDRGVRAGLRVMQAPSEDHVAAFELLSAHIHDEDRWLVHKLRPGQMVVFDNARVLHGRQEILGSARRDLKRLNGNYWPEHAPLNRGHAAAVAGR